MTSCDRLFWVGLSLLWTGWRAPLVYVRADTVVRWQRERFRSFWARWSRVNRRHRGQPATAIEIRRLIERVVAANPPWRAPRIHGELKMLGIEISKRTVSESSADFRGRRARLGRRSCAITSVRWFRLTFFTVPTIILKVLFVFIILEHRRREVVQ